MVSVCSQTPEGTQDIGRLRIANAASRREHSNWSWGALLTAGSQEVRKR
jgi:hypothetical protein